MERAEKSQHLQQRNDISNDEDDHDDDDDDDDSENVDDYDDERGGGLHKSIAHFRTSGLLKANIGWKKVVMTEENEKGREKKFK